MEQQSIIPIQSIKVRRIKTITFNFDELDIPVGVQFIVNFQQTTQLRLEADFLFINFNVFYTLPDKQFPILNAVFQNVFEIPNLSNFVINDNISLPPETVVALAGLCVSHARALLSIATSGSIYQDTLLPIVNPFDIAKMIFPGALADNIQSDLQSTEPLKVTAKKRKR